MRGRGRLVVGSAALVLALLVTCIWLVPSMLDWNRYRDGIAALASQQLGRPVHIGGGVSLQLLPQPILVADDVSVEAALLDANGLPLVSDEHGQPIGPEGVGLRARALRLRVALGPLLAGKVDARELILQGADLRLPWPPPPGALTQRPPTWLTGLQARIEDGRLQVGSVVFTGITGTVTTDPDTGTLAAAGTWLSGAEAGARESPGAIGSAPGSESTSASGAPAEIPTVVRRWQFTARLGRPARDGSAPFDVSLDGQDRLRDTGGSFSGQISAEGGLSGRIAGRGPDLSLLMPAPPLPWRGDGQLKAAGGLAVADELALEIGGAPARGTVSLRVQPRAQLEVAITAGRLDLDAWLPALLGPTGSTLRSGIPTGIDLSAEAATLGGGTLRRLHGGVDLLPGVLRLRDITAVLPGEAALTMAGQVTKAQMQAQAGATAPTTPPTPTPGTAPASGSDQVSGGQVSGGLAPGMAAAGMAKDQRPIQSRPSPDPTTPPATGAPARFDGEVTLRAPDLRTTLRWLQRAAPWVGLLPDGVLQRATLSARVVADAGQAKITELKGQVDDSAVSGTAAFRVGARPGATATLALDRLALDAWLPEPSALASGGGTLAQGALTALRRVDGDVTLQVGSTSWRGVGLGAVAIEAESDASRVVLRRLEMQPLGGTVSASGQVAEGGRLSDARLEASLPDISALRPMVSLLQGVAPDLEQGAGRLLRGAGTLQVLAAGPPDAVTGRVALTVGDLRLEAQPTANLLTRRWTGPLTLHHPGAPRFLEGLGLAGTAPWLGDGSLSLVGRATMAPGRFEMEGATVAAGSLRASGQMALDGRKLSGALAFEALPLPLPYPRSPELWPLGALRGWQASVTVQAQQILADGTPVLRAAAGEVRLESGVLNVALASGEAAGPGIAGGSISGEMRLDSSADPPQLTVRGAATGLTVSDPVFSTALDLVAGKASATGSLSASGHSPAALLATLAGQGEITVRDGLLAGFDLAEADQAVKPVGETATATAPAAATATATAAVPAAATAAATATARGALLSGHSSFTTLAVPFTVARGLVGVAATLDSAAGMGRMTGSLDLQNATVDLRLALIPAAPAGAPELGLRVAGPGAAPVRTPELAALSRWLADRRPPEGRPE